METRIDCSFNGSCVLVDWSHEPLFHSGVHLAHVAEELLSRAEILGESCVRMTLAIDRSARNADSFTRRRYIRVTSEVLKKFGSFFWRQFPIHSPQFITRCADYAYRVRKSGTMESNAYDFETMRQIEALEKLLGGLPECKRLGFIFEHERGVMSISTAGFGYLLYVEGREIKTLAEAFAAGYECAHAEMS